MRAVRQSLYERQVLRGWLTNFASAWAFYFATYFLHLGQQLEPVPSQLYVGCRYLLGLLVFGSLFLRHSRRPSITWRRADYLILRGLYNLAALLCFYRSVEQGQTGRANVLNMTYPAFVAIFAGPMLGERVRARTFFLVALSVGGIVLNFYNPGTGPGFSAGNFWGLLSGVTAGVAVVALRGAATRSSGTEILTWMFAMGSLLLIPINLRYIVDSGIPATAGYIFVSSGFGVIGQWWLTASYRHLDAATGSIVSTTRIPIAVLMGYLFLAEPFVALPWAGAAVILTCNVLLAFQVRAEKLGGGPSTGYARPPANA